MQAHMAVHAHPIQCRPCAAQVVSAAAVFPNALLLERGCAEAALRAAQIPAVGGRRGKTSQLASFDGGSPKRMRRPTSSSCHARRVDVACMQELHACKHASARIQTSTGMHT